MNVEDVDFGEKRSPLEPKIMLFDGVHILAVNYLNRWIILIWILHQYNKNQAIYIETLEIIVWKNSTFTAR